MTNQLVIPIILNWNNYEDTSSCIESLLEIDYENISPILVDNGSSDGSGERLDEEFEDIETIFLDSNRGFAGGINAGIREALQRGADYIWVLNNDILFPDKNILHKLVTILNQYEKIGIVTPKINHYPGTDKTWFLQGKINWRTGITDHITDTSSKEQFTILENDTVPYCCALFRAQVFRDIGLLPEKYFIYTEDRHYCTVLRNNGYKIATLPDTLIYHKVSEGSDSAHGPTPTYYMVRNSILFLRSFPQNRETGSMIFYHAWLIWRVGFLIYNSKTESLKPLLEGWIDGISNVTGRSRYP
ncbi:hypothetical protein SAMN05192561_10226 [Halopenitus malekzadehii]|uniref:Glycosyltransferase 2-like domain-containing protein n=1 Tax=Halopenitus malekzadehii TaxID=1267564 RepID=A0A1H6I9P2_9EURY|nr:glycosyltransferase family 2 protein [Halopenitus malekzadehii]SEH45441.1 hypothetical protein SAMN05192561_10226 [Halopenitus malekzadehii]